MNPSDCQPCCTLPATVDVPGSAGAAAFTTTTANATVPAVNGALSFAVLDNTTFAVGEIIFVSDGTDWGHFRITSFGGTTTINTTFESQSNDASPGAIIGSGATVAHSGEQPIISGIASFTDNTTGTASDTLAAGTGVYTLSFYIEAASIANGDLMTNYVPGHAFKILAFDARCAKVVSTGAKASTLNLEIGTTNLTGGVISLSGTYALGAAQAGTAVTANNVGTAVDSFSIEASSTTAFTEGAFELFISIQNMDTANSVASLADKINDILTALA